MRVLSGGLLGESTHCCALVSPLPAGEGSAGLAGVRVGGHWPLSLCVGCEACLPWWRSVAKHSLPPGVSSTQTVHVQLVGSGPQAGAGERPRGQGGFWVMA